MIIAKLGEIYIGPLVVVVFVIVVLALLIWVMHHERRRRQAAHWAVYILDERTDLYGEPVSCYLTRKEAWTEAKSWADELYPQGYRHGGTGYVRAGRPGAVSVNVLVWDMNARRD